jgi:hypothetical protein
MGSELTASLLRENVDEFENHFMRYFKWRLYMKDVCRVQLSQTPISEKVRDVWNNFHQRVQTHDIKGIRDSVLVLRRLARVFNGIIALCCEYGDLMDLGALCSQHFNIGSSFSTIAKHYALLEIEPGATEDEISSAYRRKSLDYHPDKGFEVWAAATERLQQSHPRTSRVHAREGTSTHGLQGLR